MYVVVVGSLFAIFISPWVWKMTQSSFFTGQAIGEVPNTLLGIRNLSYWFAGLAIIFGLIPTFVCKERYYANASKQKKEPLTRSLKMTFASRPFKLMLGLILAGSLEGLVVGMGGYISLYYVFGGDKVFAAGFHGVTGMIGGVVGLLAAPLFGWLAIQWGKERALLLVTVIHVLMAISIVFFYNPAHPWLAAVPMILNGAMVGAFWVIIPSMKADIVDDDELKTGERREGSFESVFSWLLRFTGTVFAGLSGFVVVFLGFDIEMQAEQAEGVFNKMIWAMALVPTLLGALQFYIIMRWPLTAGRMAEIRTALEARRGSINMQKDS